MEAFQDVDGFFTGLSIGRGTRPGFFMNNETFKLRFEGIQVEKLCSETQMKFVKSRFESCYNWEKVMEMILECFEYYYDEGDFQIDCQTSIKAWLSEYGGWGLLFTLLPMEFQKLLIILFAHMNVKNSNENVVKSNEEMFKGLMDLYEIETQGMPLSDLVPRVEAKLHNIISGVPKMSERTKLLKVKFLSQRYTLIANFVVEKKRLRRTLVEHAAEVVGKIVEDPEELEIPETLKPLISDKIIDADWVASHWWAKYTHDMQKPDIKLEAVVQPEPKENEAEDCDNCDKIDKTVHQVVPVPRFPVLNCFLQTFVLKPFYAIRRAFGHLFSLLSTIRK